MAYTKRDSKDPMPKAENYVRGGEAGNTPVTGEKHGQSKGRKISASSNRTTGAEANAVAQPERQGEAGNTSVTGESHNQKKAQRVTESQRW
jgi:hypothetical protein